jgi:hypothetical protein
MANGFTRVQVGTAQVGTVQVGTAQVGTAQHRLFKRMTHRQSTRNGIRYVALEKYRVGVAVFDFGFCHD